MDNIYSGEDLDSAFNGIDISSMAFIALAAIPEGSEVKTRYGTIKRLTYDSFTIEIKEDIIEEKKDNVKNKKSALRSVKELFGE